MQLPVDYILHLADTALVLGHRNSEWCGHGPVLEQDIAITNISLDLIGQARHFYQYAATLLGNGYSEDRLAYFRSAAEFKNLTLAELPKEDWAHTILRQFYISSYQSLLFSYLKQEKDEQVAAIAEKCLKEITYHLRWSSEWVIRLGDGTEESKLRIEKAAANLHPYLAEIFFPAFYEQFLAEADRQEIKKQWLARANEIFEEAGLLFPGIANSNGYAGKTGQHTVYLEQLLTEMQVLPRTYPNAVW